MEEKNLSKSNKIKVIVLTMLLFLIAISGITYAYFSIQIVGNEEASSIRVTTANLKLIYTYTLVMSGEKIYPGWSETKTITVENAGNQDVYYNIIWRELLNEITNDELVISATCTSSVQGNTCSNINETVIPTKTTLANNVSIKKNIRIEVGETHTYTVTVTFKETGSVQNYNQNKEFYGTLNIEEGIESATLSLQTDSGDSGLSVGDIITASKTGIDNQDFYVVSTNASETALLAKYNLLVGYVNSYNDDSGRISFKKMLSSSDTGYGLQSSTAKGYDGTSQLIGVVPFSGTNYWDDGSGNLISPYNANGASYSGNPYPNVYNNSASNIEPYYEFDGNSNKYKVQNNGYTIAYYVQKYIDTIGVDGVGRLLTYEEAQSLSSMNSSIIFNGTSYWLSSPFNKSRLKTVKRNAFYSNPFDFTYAESYGVRPVIVVPTSGIQTN